MSKNLFSEIGAFLKELFGKEETWFLIFVAGLLGFLLLPLLGLEQIYEAIIEFLKLTWWLWLFFLLFKLFKETWLHMKQEKFEDEITWVLLELRIPRNVEKSPQAMEQVLAAINALRNAPGDFKEKYIDGEVTRWFSLEMVSFGGEVHFYIRTFNRLKSLVEAAFFSYYPDLDIVEVPDYIDRFPASVVKMYEKGLDLWGTEMLLGNAEFYPIKTYSDFEQSAEEEKKFDPISAFLEVLSKLNTQEFVGIQILIAPAGPEEWKDKWAEELEKLRQQSKGSKGGLDDTTSTFTIRSPRQTEILKAVEENLSKPAFDTLIRFVYVSPKATFFDSFPRRGLVGAFNQYAALDLNSFTQNRAAATRARIWNKPYIFPKTRVEYKKARILFNYRHRAIPPETFIGRVITSYFLNWNESKRFKMNTKCLATLFHIPTTVVLTEPHLRHLESRKTGPPAGLAIFGEEGEITKYK